METINKLLIGLVAMGFVACVAISYMFINQNNIIKSDKDTKDTTSIHPYNTCIKLFIDQADKKDAECDFEKAKSVCFDLIGKKTQ